MAKRMIAAMLALVLLCGMLPACAQENVTEKTAPLYLMDLDHKTEINLNFLNGQEDIPYVTAEEMCRLLNLLWRDLSEDEGFEVTLRSVGAYTLLERENQASVYIDFEQGLLGFSQYDKFFATSKGTGMLDIVVTGGRKDADPDSVVRHLYSEECNGEPTDLNLREYEIPTPVINGTGYLPLQTFSDLFMAASGAALYYNGEIAIAATGDSIIENVVELTELGKLYYSVTPRPRSEALAEFTLNEMCLALDVHYGLKEEHGITKFADFFARSGLVSDLLDPDAKVSSTAVFRLCSSYFADGHSALSAVSPYTQYGEQLVEGDGMSLGMLQKLMNIGEYYSARVQAYPDGMPGYEEVGNTAYVAFDAFSLDPAKDYYSAEIPQEFNALELDTLELLIYANGRINRENSPIENVVLDLSCNVGGMVDAAVCVCSWMLGTGQIYLRNMLNGASGYSSYMFDANLDHEFDSGKDSVNGKNLFCLISPISFSCGNLVPASLRSSGKVTLLGKATTGGTCTVQTLSLADGTLLQVSSRLRVNTVNNGIYYSVDAGVEPHYYLPNNTMLYDREKLTEYINGLMW